MIPFFLFLILLVLVAQGFQLRCLIDTLKKPNDFSKEDASVKATTEAVRKAKGRLPKEN